MVVCEKSYFYLVAELMSCHLNKRWFFRPPSRTENYAVLPLKKLATLASAVATV